MAKTINTSCSYKAPNGQDINVPFEQTVYESIQDAVAVLGDVGVVRELNRMAKIDGGNVAREKAKVINGHSTRVAQTEEHKSKAKAAIQLTEEFADALKAKGITSLDQLAGLL